MHCIPWIIFQLIFIRWIRLRLTNTSKRCFETTIFLRKIIVLNTCRCLLWKSNYSLLPSHILYCCIQKWGWILESIVFVAFQTGHEVLLELFAYVFRESSQVNEMELATSSWPFFLPLNQYYASGLQGASITCFFLALWAHLRRLRVLSPSCEFLCILFFSFRFLESQPFQDW